MRKKWQYLSIIIIIAILLNGCGSSQDSQQGTTVVGTADTVALTTSVDSEVVLDTEFTASDLDVGYEDSTATHISFNGSAIEVSGDGATATDGVLTINKEGSYVMTGILTDGQIIVDAKETDKVQIVLNGVSITCSDNAPIYIKNADKIFITLEEGTDNTLTDGSEYNQTDDNTVDGVIFSMADLTINGDGTLNITANYKHGIVSKDDLVITGGTFNITAVKDALNGNDCVKINDGTFELIATTGNGIQSKNGDDTTKGYVYISGGDITILKSKEGIEGTAIIIEDGTINITAEDDGMNASSGDTDTTEESSTIKQESNITILSTNEEIDSTSTAVTKEEGMNGLERPEKEDVGDREEFEDRSEREGSGNVPGSGENPFEADTNCYISIKGGTIIIDASGDGIDSNGSLYISGGNLYISGPANSGNGGLDYNGIAEINGGTVIVAGSSGMAQGFSDTSSQYSILNNLTTDCEAGTEIILTDNDSNVVASYTPNKQYQSVVISTPELIKDETYTLTCGDQNTEITLSSVVTSSGQSKMGMK